MARYMNEKAASAPAANSTVRGMPRVWGEIPHFRRMREGKDRTLYLELLKRADAPLPTGVKR